MAGCIQVPESANELQAVVDDLAVAAAMPGVICLSFSWAVTCSMRALFRQWAGQCWSRMVRPVRSRWGGDARDGALAAVAGDDLLAGELVRVGVAGDRDVVVVGGSAGS